MGIKKIKEKEYILYYCIYVNLKNRRKLICGYTGEINCSLEEVLTQKGTVIFSEVPEIYDIVIDVNTITELKNTLEEFNSKLKPKKKPKQSRKRNLKSEDSLRDLSVNIK